MELRAPTLADEADAVAAHEELGRDDFEFLLDRDRAASWADYLDYLEGIRLGIAVPSDRIRATFLFAHVDDEIVGRLSLRHELTPFLATVGGHIGYAVRPGFRRRGYATGMLRQGLRLAADLGLERVLVTCDQDNLGSAKVIERCGGVLSDVVPYGDAGKAKRRYWLSTSVADNRNA